MRFITLLLFTLMISSCNEQNEKEKEAVCQTFSDLNNCKERINIIEIQKCFRNIIQNNTPQKINLANPSSSQRKSVIQALDDCQKQLYPFVTTTGELGDEYKETLVEGCIEAVSNQGKSIFECD